MHQFGDGEIRSAPYMENIVTIYRSLDATFSASFLPASLDAGRASQQCPISVKTKADDKISKDHVETPQEGNSSNGKSIFSLTVNKLLNDLVEDGIQLTGKSVGSKPRIIQGEELDMGGGSGGMDFIGEDNSIPLRSCVQERDEKDVENERKKIAVNQTEQFSPASPPSFCVFIDLDGDTSDPDGSKGNIEKSARKRSLQNDTDLGGSEMFNRCTSAAKCEAKNSKRQKILNSDHNGSKLTCYENKSSECKLEPKLGDSLSSVQSTVISDPSDANRSVCAFCDSSKLTDGTGPMLHYVNGKEVVGDVGTFSNIIHVHSKCIDWTPQVYYEGERIKNLESELARAAKLRCSYCGKRGAALGCFVQSCRKSYHVPCALVVDCRWDGEEFLMLCPTHNSIKFPREISNSVKHLESTQTISKQSNFWSSPCGTKEWVFCGSALSAEEMCHLVNFASDYDATVTSCWKTNVTHVIAATDGKGACKRTLKVLMAILNGRWILTLDWLKACIEAKKPLDEEPYEVSLDNHGCRDGPRTGRLRASGNAPKLFDSFKFFFSGHFVPADKTDLIDLVTTAGGTVVVSREQLMAQNLDAQATPSTTLVVYNVDPPQLHTSRGGSDGLWKRLAEAEELTHEIGLQVIKHTWILDSIAACKLKPLLLYSSPGV
ncbi:hypothetical protein LguiA_011642 [Lonicera macranthoides]